MPILTLFLMPSDINIKRMSDFHKPDTPITKNINEKRKSLILTLIPNYEKTSFELC